jgi:hypothetical protein
VWGETIVPQTNVLAAEATVTGQTIVWDSLDALTIVWGDTTDDSGAQ